MSGDQSVSESDTITRHVYARVRAASNGYAGMRDSNGPADGSGGNVIVANFYVLDTPLLKETLDSEVGPGFGTLNIHQITVIGQGGTGNTCSMTDRINVYSFALKPEEHQPSGTCNFSRIDSAKFIFTTDANALHTGNLNIYAHNYNVLRT